MEDQRCSSEIQSSTHSGEHEYNGTPQQNLVVPEVDLEDTPVEVLALQSVDHTAPISYFLLDIRL